VLQRVIDRVNVCFSVDVCFHLFLRQLWLTMRWEESWAPWLVQQQWIDPSWQNTSYIYDRTIAGWGRIVDALRWSGDGDGHPIAEHLSTGADPSSRAATSGAGDVPTNSVPSPIPTEPVPAPTPGTAMPGGPLPWQNQVLLELAAMTDGLISCWEDLAIFLVALALAVLVYIRRGA
jgi:hypothetical protein